MRTPQKEGTGRPTKRQTKHKQTQRPTKDREDDPAQPLLPQEQPGVLRRKKTQHPQTTTTTTTTTTKNHHQNKNSNDNKKQTSKNLNSQHHRTEPEKQSKTPAGVRFGSHQTQRVEKESPPPPSCRIAILPILARSREGRAIDKRERGVGGIPFLSPGTKKELDQKKTRTRKKKKINKNRKAPRPIANHPGPRSTMDLDPGVEMQWAGGPEAVAERKPQATKPVTLENSDPRPRRNVPLKHKKQKPLRQK